MRFIKPYVICLFAFLQLVVASQTPSFNFQKLGSEEGLNNANIFNIEQHQNGLMYFATQNGVYYYDGYNFNKLEIDSLKSNALISVFIKNSNELLLSIRDQGIAVYNIKKKTFALHPQLKFNDNNADNIILTENYAYLLTSEIKLVMVDLKSGAVRYDALKTKDKLNPNLAFCMYKTKAGKILIGRSDGLYDLTNGRHEKINALGNYSVHSIAEDKLGRLIIGSASKIFILNNNRIETEITPTYKTKSNTFQIDGGRKIDKIIVDDYGRIWFTSNPGENLYLYMKNNVYDVFDALDIPTTLINSLYKDSEQNIWIGTNNDGVYYIQNPFFTSVNFSFGNKNLNINEVHLKGNLLVAATTNGLFGLNLTNYETKTLSHPDEFMEPITGITYEDGTIYYTKRSQLDMSPAMFFDSQNSYKFKPVIAKQFYPINENQSIVADWDLNILLCNKDGTKTTDTLISFSDYRISVNALLKQDDLLYIATSNGLYVFDFKTHKYKNLVRNELNYNINDIAIINHKLYAAHEAGITDVYENKLIQEIGEFRLNTVKKIKHFSDQIWLATLDGVFICDEKFNPLKTINKSNGLLSNSVNDITFNDQSVSIATARGVATTEFKNIIRYSSKLKPVTINHISWNGENFESDKNLFVFNAEQENISINFYSPLFNKPNKQFFKWRMDGAEWKIFNTLYFDINLTGGSHQIEICASADNILWSEATKVQIIKEEKLTERQSIYWLITIGGLSFISLVSFVWIRRVKIKGKKRLQEEQQVNLLKHQAMNSLLSPHFIFNSLTSIQNYINTNNGLRASEYLAKFSRLIRMIIEKAAQSDISLHDELSRLTYYLELEKERFKNKFDYTIDIDESINTHEIHIPNMIIQPYVENCIIHGILPKQEHGHLLISFKRVANKKLLIVIEDNGIGLIKAKEHAKTGHKSLGTNTINSILEINSKLSGKSQKVTMTDKSTLEPAESGTIITLELEL